jgi:superfamily II DNA or RNA helicase
MKPPVLRAYQHQARDALHNGYAKGLHRPGVQLPTGTGKTVVIGDISNKVIASARHSRVNILLHRDTLVEQTIRKLLSAGIDPDDIGVVKANRHDRR